MINNDLYLKLKKQISSINSGETLTLDKKATYHIYEEDIFKVKNVYLSNTCSYEEKSDGLVNAAIYIENKSEIVIDGNGAKFILHGHITPFLFVNIKGLEIKNLKIDYAHPTMSEFEILDFKDGKYTIRINKDCLFSFKKNNLIFHSEKNTNGGYYWSYGYRDYLNIAMFHEPYNLYTRTQVRDTKCKFPCIPEFKTIKKISSHILEVELVNNDNYFKVGDTCEVRDTKRDQIGGAFLFSKNIKMKNMQINAMHGFGILSEMCENVEFSNNKIIPKKGRRIASNADFYHFSCCRGKIEIRNNELMEGHDDFINIHGIPLEIEKVIDNRVIVKFKNDYSFGFDVFKDNDQIEIIDPKNLKRKGKYTIKSHKLIDLKTIELQLFEEASKLKSGYFVNNLNNNPQIFIKNNKFGPSMGRGILVTSNNKTVISNNVFYKLGGAVLYIANDYNFWFESGSINKVVFKNNRIHDCGYNPFGENSIDVIGVDPRVMEENNDSIRVHNELVIKNNCFTSIRDDKHLFSANFLKKLIVENNYFDKGYIINSRNCEVIDKGNFRERNIILFGDSIAFGDQVKFNYSWARMLNNDNRIGVNNYAVRGFATINYIDNFEKIINASLRENARNIVMIALGTNDSLLLEDKEYVSLDKYKILIEKYIKIAHKYTKDIVIVGLTSCDESKTSPICWSEKKTCYLNERLSLYNECLKRLANENNIGFIDLSSQIEPKFTVDGLHPNLKGHKKMYNIVHSYIFKHF